MPTLRPHVLALTCLLAVFLALAPARAQEKGEDKGGDSPVEIMTDPPMVRFNNAPKFDIPVRKPEPPSPPLNWGFCDRPYKECVSGMKKRARQLDEYILRQRRKIGRRYEKRSVKDKEYVAYQLLNEILFRTQLTVDHVVDLVEWSDTFSASNTSHQKRKVFQKLELEGLGLMATCSFLKEYGAEFSSYGYRILTNVCNESAERIRAFTFDLAGYYVQEVPGRDGPQ